MNAFEKLKEKLEKQEVRNRLNSWHESMLKALEDAKALQRCSQVDWETVRVNCQKAAIFRDMLYGAIEILCAMGEVDRKLALEAERQLDKEAMKGIG